jgi:hypothetical protein
MSLDIQLSDPKIQIYLDNRELIPKLIFTDSKDIDKYLLAFHLDNDLDMLIVLANMFIDTYEYLTQKKELDAEKHINYN